jgi:ectoine hydroxylase-related dioxygenase (phytanoyl-CoA dioxygenase family)
LNETALKELRTQGFTILRGVVEPERLDALRNALDRVYRDEAHVPRQTAEKGCLRGYNLVRRDTLFREALQEPAVVELAEAMLGQDCILHSFESRSALPGGGQQLLHRDMPYADGVCLSVNCVWMLDDFTEENGATRVVPFSHLRAEGPEANRVYQDEYLAIEPAGTVLLFNMLTWHGGGHNRTNRIRRAFHVHYCRSWVKPQRDHPRSMDADSLRDATPLLVRLLGYHSQMEFEPVRNEHQRLPVPPTTPS